MRPADGSNGCTWCTWKGGGGGGGWRRSIVEGSRSTVGEHHYHQHDFDHDDRVHAHAPASNQGCAQSSRSPPACVTSALLAPYVLALFLAEWWRSRPGAKPGRPPCTCCEAPACLAICMYSVPRSVILIRSTRRHWTHKAVRGTRGLCLVNRRRVRGTPILQPPTPPPPSPPPPPAAAVAPHSLRPWSWPLPLLPSASPHTPRSLSSVTSLASSSPPASVAHCPATPSPSGGGSHELTCPPQDTVDQPWHSTGQRSALVVGCRCGRGRRPRAESLHP